MLNEICFESIRFHGSKVNGCHVVATFIVSFINFLLGSHILFEVLLEHQFITNSFFNLFIHPFEHVFRGHSIPSSAGSHDYEVNVLIFYGDYFRVCGKGTFFRRDLLSFGVLVFSISSFPFKGTKSSRTFYVSIKSMMC